MNTTPSAASSSTAESTLPRRAPLQVGDWVALGLEDGRCPVGEIEAMDSGWISVRKKSFLTGRLMPDITVVRWVEIVRIEAAYREDKSGGEMRDEHLGDFQAAWHKAKGYENDPVEVARRECRKEQQANRRP
jgi:hypothetical protein